MAYVSNMDDQEKKNAAQGTVSPVGGSSAVPTSAGNGVGATGGTGAAPANPNAGGSFATLNKYIDANQGQAPKLTDKLMGGINDQYNTLNQGNQSTLSGIQNDVNSGYTKNDPNLLAQENADPVSFASDSGNVGNFQKLLNDQFNGPNSAEGDNRYQNQNAAINSAISQGQASTQTEAGRKGLLAKNEAAPTQGVTALNSAILSEDPNSLGRIENAYKPFSNLSNDLSTGAQGINGSIATAKQDAQTAHDTSNKQINDQVTGLNDSINNAVGTSQTALNNYNSKLPALQSQFQTVEQGLKGAQAGTGLTFNDPLSQLMGMQQVSGTPTAANTATADQYKQAQAFQNLLAGMNNGLSPVISQDTAGQAGTAPTIGTLPTLNMPDVVKNLAQQVGASEKKDNSLLGGQMGGPSSQAQAMKNFANLLAQLGGNPKDFDNNPYYQGWNAGYNG